MKRALLCLLGVGMAVMAVAQNEPFRDRSLTAQERAADLTSRLTLDEKISLMMFDSPAVERLDIPRYNWWNEALHGVGRNGTATVFPQSIGMAATFDDALVQRVFDAVSDEARAKYNIARSQGNHDIYHGLTFWTPNVNIFRDPRWGRGQETYGEDPYLTGCMGVAAVRGLEGPADSKYKKTIACAKHYAVHSGPEWSRHNFDARDIDSQDLWETYLPAFKQLVDAGVGQVMCAYNRVEGEPCCSNKRLLQQILRNEWGYKGLVVSDCWAVSDFFNKGMHETHPSAVEASADAVISGTDLECGNAYSSLREAYDKGLIDEATIDRSLTRVLTALFQLGEIDDDPDVPWNTLSADDVDSPEHKALALDVARKSIVLLKNNGVLPLKKEAKVLLIGPNANDSLLMWGNYNGFPSHTATLLEGMLGKNPQTRYLKGCDYVVNSNFKSVFDDLPGDADVIVFAGGISPALEGEELPTDFEGFRRGDRTSIELPAIQRELVKQLKASGKPVVFVNFSGGCVALEPEDSICDAVVQAWYPGQDGGNAIADILYGDYNPSGRLPVTFYRNDSQLPEFEDYYMAGRTYRYFKGQPLYPFGHGLSYTTFEYGQPQLTKNQIALGETAEVSVNVTNTGESDGDEIVQLYVRKPADWRGPIEALRGFKRVSIPKGATVSVSFPLDNDTFQWFDQDKERMTPQPGDYELLIGPSSSTTKMIPLKVE